MESRLSANRISINPDRPCPAKDRVRPRARGNISGYQPNLRPRTHRPLVRYGGAGSSIGGDRITYYTDNNADKTALVRADSNVIAIAILARLFWAICAIRRIAAWLERVPADFNIADRPIRNVQVPYKVQ